MTRKNLGSCSIHNCQIKSDQYHGITNNALRKAKEISNLHKIGIINLILIFF